MKDKGMKATTLTGILIACIMLIIGIIVVANWQLKAFLYSEVTATNTLKQKAISSSDNLARAQNLELYMKTHQPDVERAASIVAQTKTYQYQNQIIEDITRYANSVGLSILEFNFPENPTSAKKEAIKSILVEVTLRKPVDYPNLIRFLKYIEHNLTRMQITDISIAPNSENYALIDSPTIGLEVYVK